jgi:hypothetical protein
MLWRAPGVDPLEILKNRSTLICTQASKFVPGRFAETQRLPAGRISVLWFEFIATLCRRSFTLVRVVTFLFLKRTTGIQKTTEQLLLPSDGTSIQPPTFESVSQCLRLLRELRGTITTDRIADIIQLLSNLSLLTSQRARCGLVLGRHRLAHSGHQPLRL